MKLVSYETIAEVRKHANADKLDIVKVLGYECIVPLGAFEKDQAVILIQPDTVLPNEAWAEPFKKSCKTRVKAIKLRGEWSFGIVLNPADFFDFVRNPEDAFLEPEELALRLGITKYEPPVPQHLDAKGNLPFQIPKTDEEHWQNLEALPFGEEVDITLKIDGSSCSFYCKKLDDGTWQHGVLGRNFEYKLECENNYTSVFKVWWQDLVDFCKKHDMSLCFRGELHGAGIQKGSHNPHSKLALSWAMFSVYLIDQMRYATKDEPFYFEEVCKTLALPCVPILKTEIFTQELLDYYDKSEDFGYEGVVVNSHSGRFKIVNKCYDSKK